MDGTTQAAQAIDADLKRRRQPGPDANAERIDFTPETIAQRWPQMMKDPVTDLTAEQLEQAERRREAEADRLRRAAANSFLANRGSRYARCRAFSRFKIAGGEEGEAQQKVVAALGEYAKMLPSEVHAGNGIVLFGPSGTGKDHLLVTMAYLAIRHHRIGVEWRNGVEFYGEVRDAIGAGTSEQAVLRPLIREEILVLSDPLPPEGNLTDFQRATLYRVLEARYSDCRPTWVTLNVKNGQEAGERLGVACHDRLRDGALCLYCNWPSHRRPKR